MLDVLSETTKGWSWNGARAGHVNRKGRLRGWGKVNLVKVTNEEKEGEKGKAEVRLGVVYWYAHFFADSYELPLPTTHQIIVNGLRKSPHGTSRRLLAASLVAAGTG